MAFEQDLDPLIGTRIGPFHIDQRLAAGGMGVVYRAHQGSTEQDVAVKILAPSLSADQEYVTRFFREAGAAGQIDHPNVVRVIDVGRHEDKYYLVMQFVPGDTLDRLLDTERRMSLERATRFIKGIASGLAAAHRAGIIHRDVKPGNVIVSRDGVPHLTDFGLARHAETRKGLTIEGTFLGTPEYASPEQVEGRKVDPRTDLYSLGATYYQLLSGSFPFLGESPMEMAIRRTKEDPRPLEHSLPNADPRACAIVRKLLQKEPSQRYQTATELIRDLDAILLGQQPQVASLPKPDTKRMEPVVSAEGKRKIRFALHWGLLALGVVLAFLSGSLAARGRFLETWVAPEAWLALRAILLAAGGLAAAGSILVYRRELVYSGRLWTLLLLIPLMLLLGLAAGALLRRPEGAGPVEVLLSSLEVVVAGLAGPSSILCLAFLLLSLAVYFSFGRGMGDLAVTASRLAVAASFALVYLFGASRSGLATPFQNFMSQAELMIPLSTGAVLSCFFGAAMLTGSEYGRVTRLIGLVLCAVAMACVYAFVVLSCPGGAGGKADLLKQPFHGIGRSFLETGTLLVVVAGIGLIMHCIVTAGMRQHDRFYKKR
jgi:hypothetical protein